MEVNPDSPRDHWLLARVVSVNFAPDGKTVRSVKIKTREGVYTRPVAKLCLLEETDDPECPNKGSDTARAVANVDSQSLTT